MQTILIFLWNLLYKPICYMTINLKVGRNSKVAWSKLKGKNGNLTIGDNCIVQSRISFDSPYAKVEIGDGSYVGSSHLVCHTKINIGSDVIISWGVTIFDHDSHSLSMTVRKKDVSQWINGVKDWSDISIAPVSIESGVWIGYGSTILKGVQIGAGSVIAAKSVVTRNVPPNTLVAGNPARIIRKL
jgi:acetyltransferase-like isoleucine patch superfamily enzyme